MNLWDWGPGTVLFCGGKIISSGDSNPQPGWKSTALESWQNKWFHHLFFLSLASFVFHIPTNLVSRWVDFSCVLPPWLFWQNLWRNHSTYCTSDQSDLTVQPKPSRNYPPSFTWGIDYTWRLNLCDKTLSWAQTKKVATFCLFVFGAGSNLAELYGHW